MKITAALIRKLRDESGAPMARVKKVLEETDDEKKALEVLKKEGFEKANKRAERETSAGIVVSYVHHTGRVGVLLELLSETDFVAKNELFVQLADDLALQVASMNPAGQKELLAQDFIKNPSRKVEDLLKEVIAKTGENVRLGRFKRLEIGA